MENKFEWTDESVMDFSSHAMKSFENPNKYNDGMWEGLHTELDKWKIKKSKESKPIVKDWEIVSYSYKNWIYKKNNLGEFSTSFDAPVHLLLLHPENMDTIHSVNIFSYNQVFSIGDKFLANEREVITIDSFKIIDSELRFVSNGYRYWLISEIRPIDKPKVPLFTTEDGVKIFEGDTFYEVSTSKWTIFAESVLSAQSHRHYFKYFSTKKAAEEYIKENKKVEVSYVNIIDFLISFDVDNTKFWKQLLPLKEFFKSKIQL